MKNILLIYIISSIFFFSCRQEIVHKEGRINLSLIQNEDTINNDSIITNSKKWQLVTDKLDNINCLEVYNGILYLGGAFKNDSLNIDFLAAYNGNDISRVFSDVFLGTSIYTLKTISNRLWIGGDFGYYDYDSFYYNLLYIQGGYYGGYSFFSSYSDQIFDIVSFNDDIIIAGSFDGSGDLNTANIERISGNNIIGFDQSFDEPINDVIVFNNELYACGERDITTTVNTLGKWDGYSWQDMKISTGYSNIGYSLAEFKNQLYFAGSIYISQNVIYKLLASNTWEAIDGIKVSSVEKFHLYATDDYLYFFGKGISINGLYKSNVIRYDGSKCEAVGEISEKVNDVKVFNSKLYAATDNGLYVLQ